MKLAPSPKLLGIKPDDLVDPVTVLIHSQW